LDCTVAPGEDAEGEVGGASDPAALLARGHYAHARDAVRLARRRVNAGQPSSWFALLECDALAALGRDPEATAVATRALARPPANRDHASRLRVARALALWHTGRVAAARGEARRAVEQSEEPLTRARALEALALFAWRDQEIARAAELAGQSLALYEAGGSPAGVIRALGLEAAVATDAWRMAGAMVAHDRRVRIAARLGRPHLLAEARVDRAIGLAVLGRWEAAARELESAGAAAGLLPFTACLLRATLARARGDLGVAQRALAAAHDALPPCARPRLTADWHVLAADVVLAGGDAAAAEREAVEAIRLADLVADRAGRCRGRIRRVHALLALDRRGEAVADARRAAADAGAERPDLRAHAGLALARALWRTRPAEAERICARVAELSDPHAGFLAVARFGEALAGGDAADVIAERLAAVEAWGDRRALSYCLAELRHACRDTAPVVAEAATDAAGIVPPEAVDPVARTLVEAVRALAGDGAWHERWPVAARALAPVLPWRRAAHVGNPGSELRHDDDLLRVLVPDDLARTLAARNPGVAVVDLLATPELRLHPVRALHRLGAAILAPAGDAVVYFDLREDDGPPSERQVAIVAELGRLLERFGPEAAGAADPEQVAIAGMVGESDAMKALFHTLERAARFDLTVHVCGETGTGKERIAQALHQRSPRAARPFVAINASSLGDELFESEMFGHLRGSFTGAVSDREGHVSLAEGGTLFLDEITDLSPRAQAKLLRLLEQKEYRRVGESRMRQADVRFVTASNVPLAQRVEEGRFRSDLMYRLNRMVLTVPPLRERGDDIVLLARHFLRRAATRAGVPTPVLAPDAERALRGYGWPGNVRELENEMGRLLVMSGPGRIRRPQLAPVLLEPPTRGAASLREAVLDFERAHITRALGLHGGNRARTACLLGLTRQALVAKISRLGIGRG
jgi:DNA-binding NtrC family response regulator